MRYLSGAFSALALATCGQFISMPGAQADPGIYILENVAFESDEPGTATGQFSLTVYGYFATTAVSTTSTGTWPGPLTYSSLSVDGTPPSTTFELAQTGSPWELVLEFTQSLTPTDSGEIDLVPGSGTPGDYTGSYEICTYSSDQCDGVTAGDARLITAGEVLVPEPSALAVLGVGLAAVAGIRRRRIAEAFQSA